jgi:hypothetical protein
MYAPLREEKGNEKCYIVAIRDLSERSTFSTNMGSSVPGQHGYSLGG